MKKELILIFFIVLIYSCSSVRVIYDFDSTINFSNYSSFAFSKQEVEKLDIAPSMIQPVKEIRSLGKFKVKISLHSEIEAEIHIVVESAETIQ